LSKRRVIGYTRVSTQEQVEGFGLDVQEAGIRAYCKAEGLQLVVIYSDAGISGSNGLDGRQGLGEALAQIESGKASALVVYRFDRLARDVILQETLIRQLQQQSADVVSVQEPTMEGDEHTRVMVRQILGVLAQYERSVIRGRMMAGKAAKVAKGGYGGGRPAYGYDAKDKALVPNPSEQRVVARIQALHDAGASLRDICAALEAEGHTTKRGGHTWQPNTVRRVLQRTVTDATAAA
jgi:DNA invertase Pin-like site-specific DNA recombinase